jgi:RND family efflux transporter MFP subunit
MFRRAFIGLGLFLAMLILANGCRRNAQPAGEPATTVVPVSHPVQRNVTEYVEYTGRADAVESVGIRARVTGYLVKAPFKEGAEVKKNDLLFEIDPRPYKAQLDQAVAQVAVNEASLKFSQASMERAKATFDKGAGSKQDVDQAKAAVDESQARVDAAKSTVKLYQLNLDFTQVRSPIDGQVSRYYYTLGNLINQDQTLLTTVVSVDPMYAYFDMDERTLLRIRVAINEGKIKPRGKGHEIPVMMGLEGEDGYPHQGEVNFVNNVINPSTGTIAIRGVFPNPVPANGRRLLSPGMFVRIRLPVGSPHPALLVVDRALASDQGLKYAYVVGADRKLEYRRVKTGALEDDGLRVIEEGLKPDDWVVIGAIPQLRPKMEVDPEPTAMPTPGAPEPPAHTNNAAPVNEKSKK